jgi:hypothetical protein
MRTFLCLAIGCAFTHFKIHVSTIGLIAFILWFIVAMIQDIREINFNLR